MSRAVIVGLICSRSRLVCLCGTTRPPGRARARACCRSPQRHGIRAHFATAKGFVVSASSQTQFERELPRESFYSKELLWLNASRDGDSVRMNAHVRNTRDGARRTQPSLSPTAQRVIARIQSDCVIAVARPE